MFEKATRNKFRFQSIQGQLSVEMLWDLPLTSRTGMDLDTVAKAVNQDLKDSQAESFVKKVTTANSIHADKLEIVKHIIKVKMDEKDAAKEQRAKKASKEKLLEILERKQYEDLENMSVEEIKARIEAL